MKTSVRIPFALSPARKRSLPGAVAITLLALANLGLVPDVMGAATTQTFGSGSTHAVRSNITSVNSPLTYTLTESGTLTITAPAVSTGAAVSINGVAAGYSFTATAVAGGEIWFIGNESTATANNTGGGAIWAGSNATVNVNRVFFSSNFTSDAGSGGAIFATINATINAVNATFKGNHAASFGGAIAVANGAVVNAGSAIFGENYASRNGRAVGGAIYLTGTSTLNAVGALFESNTANSAATSGSAGGGAIYAANSFADVSSGTFLKNQQSGGAASSSGGGAIFINSATVDASFAVFGTNAATANGGAIYATNASVISATGATFTSNTAGTGGAIYVDTSGTATIDGGNFARNTSITGQGGAIYAINSTLTISSGTFKNNAANASHGGALFVRSSTASIDGTMFENNKSGGNGGAIIVNTLGALTLTDASFFSNSATTTGGAVYGQDAFIKIVVSAGSTSTFKGNVQGTAAARNSVYLQTSGSLFVDVGAGGVLDMQDPFTAQASTYRIAITKTGEGSWKLAGTSTLFAGAAHTMSINEGTLHLYRSAELGTGTVTTGNIIMGPTGASTFALGSDATLSVGGGNTITATLGAINLAEGSILSFNLASYDLVANTSHTAGEASSAALLTLTAPTLNINSTANLFNFGLDFTTAATGTYNLLAANFSSLGMDTTDLLFWNNSITGLAGYNATFGIENNILWLILTPEQIAALNRVLTWTGAADNASWLALNWQAGPANITGTTFTQGDIINLDSTNTPADTIANTTTIAIDATTIATVAGLYISGDQTYKITGTNIIAIAGAGSLDPTTDRAATGKLVLGARALDDASDYTVNAANAFSGVLDLTAQTGDNDFRGGVDIHSGALRISTTGQLGTTLSNLRFLGESGDATNSGTLLIAENSTLTFDSADGSAQRLDITTGHAATLTVETGATLTITGNNLPEDIPGGAIHIAEGATLTAIAADRGGLRITNNTVTGTATHGSAIYNAGNLTLTNATLTGNTVVIPGGDPDAWGVADVYSYGAIANAATGTATLRGIEMSGNYSPDYASAIYNSGYMTIADSYIHDNPVGFSAAAILAQYGYTSIATSTIANHSSYYAGGAIWLLNGGTLRLDDVLFKNNATTDTQGWGAANGGALWIEDYTAPMRGTTLTGARVTFDSNYAQYSGGAIYNKEGTLRLDEVHFTSNTAGLNGGALVNTHIATLATATFTANTAGSQGGAIYNTATLALTNATFTNNTAAYNGGAIYNAGTLAITTATFTGNSVTDSNACGGALFNAESGDITLSGVTFTSNTAASYYGGAINNRGRMTITNAWIHDNYAEAGAAALLANGGGYTKITSSTISGNIGNQWVGGAIYVLASSTVVLDDVLIQGNKIYNNNSGVGDGGAIVIEESIYPSALLKGVNVILDANYAANNGGAIRLLDGTLDLATFAFTGNTARANAGALFINTGTAVLNTGSFTGNTAINGSGGAIFNERGTLTLTDILFTNNTASAHGGAIYNAATGTASIASSTIANNSVTGDTTHGGAIYNAGNLTLANSTLHGNTVTMITPDEEVTDANQYSHGGALFNDTTGTATLTAVDMYSNTNASAYGGALGNRGHMTIADSHIHDNFAEYSAAAIVALGGYTSIATSTLSGNIGNSWVGGAIYLTNAGTLVLNDAAFIGNQANDTYGWGGAARGGAIFSEAGYNTASTILGTNVTFKNNTAKNDGGAIASYSNMTLSSATFTSNHSIAGSGGAIVTTGSANLTAATFTNNTAGANGGAIYNAGTLAITNATFENNTSLAGRAGAIYNETTGTTIIATATFTGNTASTWGGAINNRGQMTITNALIDDNHAYGTNAGAGALLAQYGLTTITSSTLSRNTADSTEFSTSDGEAGGAIYLNAGGTLALNDVAFDRNTLITGIGGGAIYAEGSSLITGANVTFTHNTATYNNLTDSDPLKASGAYGGAIFTNQSDLALTAFAFTSNTAAIGGGGIHAYGNGSYLTLTSGTFAGNTTIDGHGGALSIGAGVTATLGGNILFDRNIALAGQGGALYATNLTLDTTAGDIAFTNNTDSTGANSIALAGGALTINGTNNVYLDDPISAASNTPNTYIQNTTGIVQFLGSNTLNTAAATAGSAVINAGQFRLADAATFTVGNAAQTLTLAATATLAGNGAITAPGGFTLQGVISPDSLRYAVPADLAAVAGRSDAGGSPIGTLNLIGDTTFNAATLRYDIASLTSHDLIAITGNATFATASSTITVTPVSSLASGTYTLLTATAINYNTYNLALGGLALTGRITGYLDQLSTELNFVLSKDNKVLTWTNTPSADYHWNTTSTNWTWDNSGSPYADIYIAGDHALFADNTLDNIITVDAFVQVAGMTITGGTYTFTGGTIASTTETTLTAATATTRRLDITNADITLATTVDFASGIAIAAAANLTLADGGAIAGTGTIGIASTGTLTIDQTTSSTLSNIISGSGGLAKLNTGTLTLTAANTCTGITAIHDGELRNQGSLASTVTVLGGRLLNTGTFTAAVINSATTNNTGLIDNNATNNSPGHFTNSGSITGLFTNSGALANATTGALALLTQLAGTATNAGLITTATLAAGDLFNTTGTITTLIQTGGVANNAALITTATINAGAFANTGTLETATLLLGALSNNTTGTIATLTQSGGAATNAAAMGSATILSGLFTNTTVATLATLTQTGGTVNNHGLITTATISAAAYTNTGTTSTLNILHSTLGGGQAAAANSGLITAATITAGNLTNTTGTLSGATIATTGTLTFNGGTLGAIASNGLLHFANTAAYTQASVITGSGTIAKTAAGDTTLAAAANAAALDIQSGKFTVATTGTLNLTGALNIANGATLGIAIGSGTSVIANTVNFNTTGKLDITGYTIATTATTTYTGATDTARTVIHTTGDGIQNFNPANITILDQTTVDFLKVSAIATGSQVIIDTMLAWNLTDGTAHGAYDIAAGTFTIAAPLANNTAASPAIWDGASLTKLGAGTLVLDGVNTYTGTTTITAGTLENRGIIAAALANNATATNAGLITAAITNNAAAHLTNTGTITAALTNTGTLVNAPGGAIATLAQTGGTATNSGFITTANVSGGTLSNTTAATIGTLDHFFGTVANAGFITIATLGAPEATLVNTGTIITLDQLTGTTTNHGLITTATLSENPNTLVNTGTVGSLVQLTGKVTNSGLITSITHHARAGGYLQNETGATIGTLTQNSGHYSFMTSGDTLNSGLITAVTLTSGYLLNAGGTLGTTTIASAGAIAFLSGTMTAPIANDGLLDFANTPAYTQRHAITGNGIINKTGSGDLTISAALSAATLNLNTGKLTLADTGSITLAGALTLADSTTLAITVGTGTSIIASTATFAPTARLDISGYTAATSSTYPFNPDAARTIIHTTGPGVSNITGFDPANVTISGTTSVDYLKVSAYKTDADIIIDTMLSWNLADGAAHGNFTIAAGQTFTINAPLANNTAAHPGWDGSTLTKLGAGTLILAGANTYTGTTAITTGTLANTGLLAGALVSNAATLLNTGTITAPVANAATLVNTGTLAAVNQTAGQFTNSGAAGNVGILLGALTNNAAATIATLTQTGGTVTNAGTITTATTSGALANSGNIGALTQTDGLVTNTGAITTAATINGGTLANNGGSLNGATAIGAAGTLHFNSGAIAAPLANNGNITFANTAPFTFDQVITGAGSLNKTGSGNLTIATPQTYTGPTSVKNGTLILAAPDAIAASNHIDLASATTLDLGGHNQTLKSLALANGARVLHNSTGANYTTLTIGKLTGTGAFSLRVSPAAGSAAHDTITIADPASEGVFEVDIALSGNLTAPVELIKTTAPAATFTGVAYYGIDEYALEQTPAGWQLSTAGLNETGDIILSTAAVLGSDWLYSLDSVRLRMGELRLMPASASGGDVWVRTNFYRLNGAPGGIGDNFRQNTWGVTAGANATIGVEPGSGIHLGGFVQMGGSDRTYRNYGKSATDTVALGIYGTIYTPDGWYVDAVLKYDRYKNTLDARDAGAVPTTADYNTAAFGLSVEAGRRIAFEFDKRLWLEPSVQLATAWIGSADYVAKSTATDDMRVRVESSNAWQYRAQIRAGANFGRWTPYVKLAAAGVSNSGGKVRVGVSGRDPAEDRDYAADLDGGRFEVGAGAAYLINPRNQLYLDYEYNKSSSVERPWAVNLGYRHSW